MRIPSVKNISILAAALALLALIVPAMALIGYGPGFGGTLLQLVCLVGVLACLHVSGRIIPARLARVREYADAVREEREYEPLPPDLINPDSDEASGLGFEVKALADALRDRLGRAEAIVGNMLNPYILCDLDQRVVQTNEACMRLFEFPGGLAAAVGVKLAKIVYHDENRQTIISQVYTDHNTRENLRFSTSSHKGRELSLMANISPVYDRKGVLVGGLCLYSDLTELKTKEDAIAAQRERGIRVADQAHRIAGEVGEAAASLESSVEEARQGAEIQSERAADTAAAMEEMSATVTEVARNAASSAESAESARQRAQEGADAVGEVVEAVREVERLAGGLRVSIEDLGRRAGDIGRIVGVIDDIADQTNLLALNAAIEAARAGDAGRGFAVVADEVRKLAEKTMTATKEVSQVIGGIQKGAEESVKATASAASAVTNATMLAENAGASLSEIVSIVEGTAGLVASIATSSEQQSATSEEISRAVSDVSRVSQETLASMSRAAKAVLGLEAQAEELRGLIEELRH